MKRKFILIAIVVTLFGQYAHAQLNKYYFYNQARELISEQKYTQAIASLNQLIEADKSLAEAWFLRGLAKYNLNDFLGSRSDFSMAIEQNPVFSQALLYRGIVLGRLARFSEAQNDFDMVVELRPNWAEAYFSRGVNNLLLQKTQKSIDDFSKVIDFEPKNVDAWINRGTAYLYNGDSLRALNNYAQAIKLNPFYPESYSKRARLFIEMKNYHLALDDLNKAIELDSTSSINFFLRAISYNYTKNLNQALINLDKAIELAPNNALSLYNRALLNWQIGKPTEALTDFDRVATLNPENVLVYYNRGILKMESKNFSSAKQDFDQAIEIFPDFANAYRARSSAQEQLGNHREAALDRNFAHSIAEKYNNRHNQPLTDTTNTFDNLIAFNSDFSPQTLSPLIEELAASTIDILPFIRVVPKNLEEIDLTAQAFSPIDTLNKSIRQQGFALVFSTKNSSNVDSDSISVPFTKKLLAAIELSRQNKYNESISTYEAALNDSPNNPIARINLAAELADMISFIASFETGNQTVNIQQVATTDSKAKQTKTETQLQSYTTPIEINRQLLEEFQDNPIIQYNQANVYAFAGEMQEAINLYTKAITNNPKLSEAWYNRGLIYLMQKENQLGCVDMGKAGELGIKQAYLLIHRFCRR